MTRASYALLRVKNAAAARAWLRTAPITNAVTLNPPPDNGAAGRVHRARPARARRARVGDRRLLPRVSRRHDPGQPRTPAGRCGEQRSRDWHWGGPANERASRGDVLRRARLLRRVCAGHHTGDTWGEAFSEPHWLDTENLDGVEPFGFADGISQPQIDWAQQRQPTAHTSSTTATWSRSANSCWAIAMNTASITDRPLLDPDARERGPAAGAGCAGEERPRPQRHLSRDAATGAGCPRRSGSSSTSRRRR